jgi:DNA-binding NtrC family response regulator
MDPSSVIDPGHIELLVVDDDREFRQSIVRRFQRRGFRVAEASSGQEALELANRRRFDAVVLDMVMPGIDGLQVLQQLKERGADAEIILLTGQGTIESAVQAMKLGAYDYLTKPFPLAELEAIIQRACERGRLFRENRQLKEMLRRARPNWQMVGRSAAMQEVFRLIERAGPSERAILIQGESGTGKELVARALHQASPRAEKPLVTVNCAAVPETLLESELFGHERGSFTGATATRIGLFEVADGGTLFIDEIGEMPLPMQAKLLRVLEDGSFRRLGSIQERRVDVRIISATNRNLDDEVKAGRFREDLYYRINVMTIALPPLRQREGDIPLLVAHFLGSQWEVEPAALELLSRYTWPGNVRQLFNVLDRARILADDRTIRVADLPVEITGQRSPGPAAAAASAPPVSWGDNLEQLQRAKVLEVLRREQGNKTRAARALGITRRSLYRLLEKYAADGIQIEPPPAAGAADERLHAGDERRQ